MSNRSTTTRWNCLFFGMPCAFSSPILAALDRPDLALVGVVTPQPTTGGEPFLIIRRRPPGRALALSGQVQQFHAPRFLVRDLHDSRLQTMLGELQPDLIVVACYPRLIPATLAAAARIAAVNIHPSLLPRHRGPDPLFWTFQAGDDRAGVTIHAITDQFDAGDILLQARTDILPDETLPALEHRLARLGAGLVDRLFDALPGLPAASPQDHAAAVIESWPTAADRVIDPSWTVAHARRFIAGVGRSHGPLAYADESGTRSITGLVETGSGVEISLVDGVLRVASRGVRDYPDSASF